MQGFDPRHMSQHLQIPTSKSVHLTVISRLAMITLPKKFCTQAGLNTLYVMQGEAEQTVNTNVQHEDIHNWKNNQGIGNSLKITEQRIGSCIGTQLLNRTNEAPALLQRAAAQTPIAVPDTSCAQVKKNKCCH